ncbi:glycoside hydrolase family 2 TIM barrel-domain containing protein [Bacteroides oleiciplenus]|uniref:glycoside hydrolase family 2 TIM barrel-domain containing protein n=1 Tax=Bacteroides oleiciplenus TaxID=626931 RepID=UPI0026DB08B6|nr:glycoside hydrolase family 2 TIM barrel-domain containing protein [Bacteroides oleiciplenus]
MKIKMILLVSFLLCLNGLLASTITSFGSGQRHFYPVRERMMVKSLNGTWKFKLIKGLLVPNELSNWNTTDFDISGWGDITVPGNWETQGFKIPEYGNEIAELTGLYRTSFDYDSAWEGQHVILRFDGVHFGYEVFVNGQKAGQWGSAYNLCQFDITPYLFSDKKNILSVKVMTRSMGWEFDTYDCWGIAGITRNVELFAINNTYLEDVTFVSNVNPELDAEIRLRIDVNRFDKIEKNSLQLNISLSDPQNNHLLNFTRAISENINVYNFEGFIEHPLLWTAETPNLYRLEVCIVDAKGQIQQRINKYVGIRSVTMDGYELKVNHRSILLRGVCLNEIDPKSGRALTYEERRIQLLKMKEANINFIRTAHYSFAPDFLKLCNEMGFYVCNEVSFGARGADNLSKEEFIPELKARAEATIRRDKNNPSIIIWSLGNENPYTPIVEEVIKYVKEKDPTRPRGLPQKAGDFTAFTKKPSENVDIVMGHYLNDARIDQAIKDTRLPIIHTEYAHAQGNAFNEFESKFTRILKEEKVIGGSIWCWSDQAILTNGEMKIGYSSNPKALNRDARRDLPKEYQGIWIDSKRFLDTFGDRGSDGIVYADGYPKESFYLVRKMYSPVVVLTSFLNGKLNAKNTFSVELENRFDFISLHGYQLKWQVKNLQKVLDAGSFWLQIPAREKGVINLNTQLPQMVDFNDLTLYLEVLTPNGKRMYERNLPIELDGSNEDYMSLVKNAASTKKSKTKVTKTNASLTYGEYSYNISHKGVFSVVNEKGKTIETPLLLRVGRPETIMLLTQGLKNKYYWNPYLLEPIVEEFAAIKKDDGVYVTLQCRWNRNGQAEQYISGEVTVFIAANGKVQFDYNLKASPNANGNFLECGLTLDLGKSFDQFDWLGDGPYSSTPGKTAYNERAIWQLHRDDIRFNGNRMNVDVGVVTNGAQHIAFLSGNGNMGVENVNGNIHISQNAIVAGYGTKFTSPIGLLPIADVAIQGTLILFAENAHEDASILKSIFKMFPTVVPEKPYLRTYGW